MGDKLPTMPWDALKTRCVELEARVGELAAALETIAEEHDAGRHDGLPEPCPAHDDVFMWAIARAALSGSPAPVREVEPVSKEIAWQQKDGRHPDLIRQEAKQAVVEAAMEWRFEGGPVSALEQALIDLRETGGE